MNEFVATWGTPGALAALGGLFAFALKFLIAKMDLLDKELAEVNESINERFLQVERAKNLQDLYVEKTFVTKETLETELNKIDGRLGEIGRDVKEIRDLLMKRSSPRARES